MQTQTILLILLAAIVSIAVVVFQYFFRNKKRNRLNYILSFFRFIVIFCGLLLLINPKIEKNSYFLEKGKLVLLVDNSSSVAEHGQAEALNNQVNRITSNSTLGERFDIEAYTFARELSEKDSLSFDKPSTNISSALSKTNELYTNSKASILLFTDGNQTEGVDYEFINLSPDQQVFPVVVGDTTKYRDLSIGQVNLNKYAFLGNQFPIEVTVLYQGSEPTTANLTISMNGNRAYRERLEFSVHEKSKTINTLLTTTTVGIKSIVVSVASIEGEKNIANNRKETAIEVIDEQTKIALISNLAHPDIGTLKKSIETNEQRAVQILKPNVSSESLDDIDIAILYQPTSNFRSVYEFIGARKIPTITITGTKTDFQFLNRMNESLFTIGTGYPVQEVFGGVNKSFPHFDISRASLENYPPLLSDSGPIDFKVEYDVLLDMSIKGAEMESPLMALVSDTDYKKLFLFGEDLWKWRFQNFRDNANFKMFDEFMGKLMVFLSKSGKRNRLEIDYEKVYEGPSLAKIRASFFDQTFILDPNANLVLRLSQENKLIEREIPMLFKGSYFEADLSDLPSGTFDFTVTEQEEKISSSGSFKILEFDPEKQFLSANDDKLFNLASRAGGNLYFLGDIDSLVTDLATNDQYVPIQKSKRKVVSLIDFRFILGIMVLALAAEWSIRKFNGLL